MLETLLEFVRQRLANSGKLTEESRSLMVGDIETCGGQVSFSTDKRISRHRLENLKTAILMAAAAKFGTTSVHSYWLLAELSVG
jgi:hypothetical protein